MFPADTDCLVIEGLEVFARHGVFPEEAALGQRFFLTARCEAACASAGYSDALEETENYADIAEVMRAAFLEPRRKLVEAAAQQTADAVLARFPRIRAIELTVEKPSAPIALPFRTVSITIRRARTSVALGLGGNLEGTRDALRGALERLPESGVRVLGVSSLYETKPWGVVDQPDFLNMAVVGETTLPPLVLLDRLQAIEAAFGRDRRGERRWGERVLDIDLLLYGDLVMGNERLVLPHPHMSTRDFVLVPLSEIAPNRVHPLLGKSIGTLAQEQAVREDAAPPKNIGAL